MYTLGNCLSYRNCQQQGAKAVEDLIPQFTVLGENNIGTGKSEVPLAHCAKYAATENGHIDHCIGSKEEQTHSFCTAE